MNRAVTLGLVRMAMGPEREANVEHAFVLARRARERDAERIVSTRTLSLFYRDRRPDTSGGILRQVLDEGDAGT